MAKKLHREKIQLDLVVNGNSAQAELGKLERQTRELRLDTKALTEEKRRLAAQNKKGTAEWDRVTAKIKQNNITIKENELRMKQLQKTIGINSLTMRQLQQEASRLRLQLANMIPGTAPHKKLSAELRAINNRIKELNINSRVAESGISRLATGFNKYFALGTSIIATGTGVVISLQKMIDYNGKLSDAQADVMKTTGMTKKEVDELTKSLGMMRTRTARMELLELATEAGRLGIEGVKNVQDFVEVANQMKVALGDVLSDEQIREVGKLANVYKVGEKTGRDFKNSMLSLGSALNEVGASGANTEDFLVEYLKRQAGVAVQAKVSAEDNIGYAATFDEIGQSVEVSATAMNKVWMDMFKNTSTYAKIAGMSIKDFTELLNTDSNEAMIRFLEGLNGNNEGLSVMVEKLADIEVGGARGAQALSAIAGQTELLRRRQKTANEALADATSLTNEYNLKNNNLAAILERIKRALIGSFSSQVVIAGMTRFAQVIERLISPLGSAVKLLEDQRKKLFELELQITSTNTHHEKRVELINQLKKEYPKYLEHIDAESASNEELRVAIRKVNEELINRIIIARAQEKIDKQNQKTADYLEKKLSREERLRSVIGAIVKRNSEFQFDSTKTEIENGRLLLDYLNDKYKGETEYWYRSVRDRRSLALAIRNLTATEAQYSNQVSEGNALISERDRLMKELGIDLTDGGTPTIEDSEVVDPTSPVTPSDGSAQNRADELRKQQEELLKINREYFNNLAALQEDSFRKELERLDIQHQERIADLSAKATEILAAYDQAIISGDTDMASLFLSQYNALLDTMEVADTEYLKKRADILNNGIEDWISGIQDQYEREKVIRETEQAAALAALGANEEARKKLQEEYNKENLSIEQKHLEEMTLLIKEVLAKEQFEGFNIDILTDAQLRAIKDKLADLGLSIEEINILLAQMRGQSVDGGLEGLGDGMQTDFLGFSFEQWETMFANLDTLQGKLEGLTMMLQGMQAAWGMYHDYVNASERKSLMEYERGINRRKNQLKTHLDSGIINQRQYNAAIEEEERKLEKKRTELEYKAAMRKWQSDLSSAIIGTAMMTINGFQTNPFFPMGIIMGTLAGILGTLQIATIRKNKPVKGFESGFYDELMVRRAQDGRMFNAQFGGESRSGVVDKPTVFLAGEGGKNFPEMIIDGRTMRQLDPLLKEQLYSEIARVRGFENGHYANPGAVDLAPLQILLEQNAVVMSQMTTVINKLQEDGVMAVMDNDMRNLHRLRKELRKMESIENKANNKP